MTDLPPEARSRASTPRDIDVHEATPALSESIVDSNTREAISMRASDPQTAPATAPPRRARLNTYTSYSIGCAGVWGAILLLAQRRLDSQTRNTLRLVCGGWWMGWTSATIARAGFPPPKPLTLAGEKRLRFISIVLVALGLTNTIRMLATGKRPRSKRAGLLIR